MIFASLVTLKSLDAIGLLPSALRVILAGRTSAVLLYPIGVTLSEVARSNVLATFAYLMQALAVFKSQPRILAIFGILMPLQKSSNASLCRPEKKSLLGSNPVAATRS